jgi:hypothetical protein
LRSIIMVAALAACGPTTPPPVALQEPVRTAPTADGAVTLARPLLARATTEDANGIVLHWQKGAEPLVTAEGVAVHQVSKTLATLQVDVIGPAGDRVHLDAGEVVATDRFVDREILYQNASLVLRLEVDAAWSERDRLGVRWKQPAAAPLFARPGRYRITVAGTAMFRGLASVPFRTPEIAIEVTPPSAAQVPAARLLETALAAINARPEGPYPDNRLEPARRDAAVVDEPDGHRRVAVDLFTDDIHRYWVEMTAAGAVTDIRYEQIFACIARGTPIATPAGARPIESLRPGDLVLARDPATGREQPTAVLAIRSLPADHLVQVGDLRATREHPIWDGDRWVAAGTLATRELSGSFEVYDLSVGPPHTFLAAGVLVHNKSIDISTWKPRPAGSRDMWLRWWPSPSVPRRP